MQDKLIQDISGKDLLILEGLCRGESMSELSTRLGYTQPSISKRLDRLRKLLGDSLFIKSNTILSPNKYALELQADVSAILAILRGHSTPIDGDIYLPQNSTFQIAATELADLVILPELCSHLTASNNHLVTHRIANQPSASEHQDLLRQLLSGQIDLILGHEDIFDERFESQKIYQCDWCCLEKKGRGSKAQGCVEPVELKPLLQQKQIDTGMREQREFYRKKGFDADNFLTTTHSCLAAEQIVSHNGALVSLFPVGMLPLKSRKTVARDLGFRMPPLRLYQTRAKTRDKDKSNRWLSDIISRNCQAIWPDS